MSVASPALYSQGGNGDANMSFSGDRYTITGTANGYKTDKPNEPASADVQNQRDVLSMR